MWEYYTENPRFNDLYFAKRRGRYIIDCLNGLVPLEGKAVLDYGSGPGYMLANILNKGLRVRYSALDFAGKSIEELKEKFKGNQCLERAYYVDKLPTGIGEKFDIIICSEVVEHLDDGMLESTVKEIRALLTGGGHVFITTPNDEDLDASKYVCPECGCIFHQWQHVRSWNKATLAGFMEKHGFETVAAKDLYFSGAMPKIKYVIKGVLGRARKRPHLMYLGRLR